MIVRLESVMLVSDKEYERLALVDPDAKWELHRGRLMKKSGMTTRHNQVERLLGYRLQQQLPWNEYEVSVDAGRARRVAGRYYIPDVMVIPAALVERMKRERPSGLEVYSDPLPLIVEVWSPGTGGVDSQTKVTEYQYRGDEEIWLLHPVERTLTTFRKQPDGSYTEVVFHGGTVRPVALPNVVIDLDELFAL